MPNIVETTPMNNTGSAHFRVVLNDEEQYSIWPAGKHNPPGWRNAGVEGTKDECLAHIGKVWIDMTPRSLRRSAPMHR